jgi:hypothetical protein
MALIREINSIMLAQQQHVGGAALGGGYMMHAHK